MNTSDFVHLNGQLVPYDSAHIPAADAGFLHGAGLFETMRVVNKKAFRLRQHLERLARSADALSIPFSLGQVELEEMIGDLLEANGLNNARLRLTITRGDLHAATTEDPVPPVTLLLTVAEFQQYPQPLYEKGMTVVIAAARQNPENPVTGHKSTSYLDRLLALREAQKVKAGEALWFTAGTNLLAEGSISNVFIVDANGVLTTPPLTVPEKTNQRLCLPGITRQYILETANAENILPRERMLTIHDLLAAKEVFLTNAIMGVMPVTHIEKHVVDTGAPGPMTQQLRRAYEAQLTAQ